MSGSSLDGLDIVYTHLDESRGTWKFEIKAAECIPYSDEWIKELKYATRLSVPDYLKLHTRYGKYLAQCVHGFIDRHSLHHQIDLISIHGHTVFHEPANQTSIQIGCGATLAALTQLPVVSDLRSLDVALGGQGAPIVPIGDKLLFPEFDYWLNIGGIVNISIKRGEQVAAFDVCAGNQILNVLAEREGKTMDTNGDMARSGQLLGGVFSLLGEQDYYKQPPPKSLSNEAAQQLVFPILLESSHSNADLLHTTVKYIAEQIALAIKQYRNVPDGGRMLVTGGGAFNTYLIESIKEALSASGIHAEVPDEQVVKFKEALVMALIGALRWREEVNVLSSVTGATDDSIGGALWMGHN
jgi:anhydro-N-acetylmuramic acid kinase